MFTRGRPFKTYAADGGADGAAPAPSPKMVPESDLMAVKTQHATLMVEANTLKSQLESLTGKHNQTFNEKTALAVERDQLKLQLAEVASQIQSIKDLESKLAASDTSRKGLEDKLLGLRRTKLIETYGLTQDAVKDLTDSQMDAIEKVVTPKRRYSVDSGASNGASTPTTAREKYLSGFQQVHKG